MSGNANPQNYDPSLLSGDAAVIAVMNLLREQNALATAGAARIWRPKTFNVSLVNPTPLAANANSVALDSSLIVNGEFPFYLTEIGVTITDANGAAALLSDTALTLRDKRDGATLIGGNNPVPFSNFIAASQAANFGTHKLDNPYVIDKDGGFTAELTDLVGAIRQVRFTLIGYHDMSGYPGWGG